MQFRSRKSSRRVEALGLLWLVGVFLTFGPSLAASPETHDPASHADCPMARAGQQSTSLPSEIGQDAFAALAEMAALLDQDPGTDWSRADLDGFREHLVDMHRVVLDATLAVQSIPGGFEAKVSGQGRTLEAIRRMIPAHARYVDGREGLEVEVGDLETAPGEDSGVWVRVTTTDPNAVARLRGLGFSGFLVLGDHHRPHHRIMAAEGGHP